MKIATAVTAHNLELAVDGLDEIGRGERLTDPLGVFQECQIVLTFFAKVGYPSWIGLSKVGAELFKLIGSDVGIPASLDGAPSFMKLNSIGFRQVSLGIALHMHRAELDI